MTVSRCLDRISVSSQVFTSVQSQEFISTDTFVCLSFFSSSSGNFFRLNDHINFFLWQISPAKHWKNLIFFFGCVFECFLFFMATLLMSPSSHLSRMSAARGYFSAASMAAPTTYPYNTNYGPAALYWAGPPPPTETHHHQVNGYFDPCYRLSGTIATPGHHQPPYSAMHCKFTEADSTQVCEMFLRVYFTTWNNS